MIEGITLILTTQCNLNCSYCFCGEKTNEVMDIKIAKKSIDFLAKNSCKNCTLTFFGGEPLLQSDLIEKICLYATEKIKNIKFAMTTNGTLLDEKNINLIEKWKINTMVSLDGFGNKHDIYRKFYNGKGSWDVISRKISEGFLEKPSIRLTFTSESINYLYDNIRALYNEGYRKMAFSHTSKPVWEEKQLLEYDKQYEKITKFYLDCYRRGDELRIYEFEDIIFSHLLKLKRKCYPGIKQIAILPSGQVVPCHRVNFLNPQICLGKSVDNLEGNLINSIENDSKKIDLECSQCLFKDRCSSCLFENLEVTGKIYSVPDYVCYFNRIKISYVDEVASILYRENNTDFMNRFYNLL